MAWIYLAESEESLTPYEIGSGQSPIVSEIPIAKLFCCPVCKTAQLLKHQSGMILRPSMYQCCVENRTSSMEDFPAKTSALRDAELAWQASEVDFIGNCTDSLKKSDHRLSSSKTSQRSGPAVLSTWSGHLPSSGMIAGGRLYRPKKLEPRTLEKDGSCLPTPTAQTYGSNKGGASGRTGKERISLETMASRQLWPTPRASDGSHGGPNQSLKGKPALASAIFRTPNASDWKNRSKRNPGQQIHLQTQVGGQLSPMWVEWLMGYPIAWTELKDWATQWFLSRRKRRLKGLSALIKQETENK